MARLMSASEQLRSPVMFYGSKARIADQIVALLPEHARYVVKG